MDPIQTPVQDPAQPPVQIPDFQPKSNYLIIVASSILGMILLASAIFLYFQNKQLKKQIVDGQISPAIQVTFPTPKTAPSIFLPSDKAINWIKYINDDLDIRFDYPPEYKAPKENNNYISLISPLNPTPKKGYELQDGELKIEIYVSNTTPNETIEDLVKKKKEQSDSLGSNTKILKEEEILIDGIKAVKQTWEGMGTGQTILFIKNDKEYGIIKYPALTTRDNEFDQIISSFRFIDQY